MQGCLLQVDMCPRARGNATRRHCSLTDQDGGILQKQGARGVTVKCERGRCEANSERAGTTTCRNLKRFREGLVFEIHRLFYHSTAGSRAIQKKKKKGDPAAGFQVKGVGRRECGPWFGAQGLVCLPLGGDPAAEFVVLGLGLRVEGLGLKIFLSGLYPRTGKPAETVAAV